MGSLDGEYLCFRFSWILRNGNVDRSANIDGFCFQILVREISGDFGNCNNDRVGSFGNFDDASAMILTARFFL